MKIILYIIFKQYTIIITIFILSGYFMRDCGQSRFWKVKLPLFILVYMNFWWRTEVETPK